MQLEAVRAISVRHLRLKVGRQVDDVDGIERALLRADTAANAQALGDEGDLAIGCNFDAQLARSYHRAGLLALLAAFLRFALR